MVYITLGAMTVSIEELPQLWRLRKIYVFHNHTSKILGTDLVEVKPKCFVDEWFSVIN